MVSPVIRFARLRRQRKGQLCCSRVLYQEAAAVVTMLWITYELDSSMVCLYHTFKSEC